MKSLDNVSELSGKKSFTRPLPMSGGPFDEKSSYDMDTEDYRIANADSEDISGSEFNFENTI